MVFVRLDIKREGGGGGGGGGVICLVKDNQRKLLNFFYCSIIIAYCSMVGSIWRKNNLKRSREDLGNQIYADQNWIIW